MAHRQTVQFSGRLWMLFIPLLFLLTTGIEGVLNAQPLESVEHTSAEIDRLLEQARMADSDNTIEALATQSLNLARSLRYESGIIRASVLLGAAAARAGRTEEALQYYLEAEDKARDNSNRNTLAGIYRALGELFYQQKFYSSALRYYTEVLAIYPEEYELMEKAGDVALLDGQYETAESYYQRLIAKYNQEGNITMQVQIYQKLANSYQNREEIGKSLFYYLRIESLINRFGSQPEKARLYNNLGRQYAALRDHATALEYFRKSEALCKTIACESQEVLYANLGIALHNTGKTQEGLVYLLKSKQIIESRKDQQALAGLEHLIAGVYYSANDLYNALNHNNTAIHLGKKTRQKDMLSRSYKTAADIYRDLYDYENAFNYYRDYLEVLDSIRIDEQSKQLRMAQQRNLLVAAEGQIKYLIARQNIRDLDLQQSLNEQARLELINKNLALEAQARSREVQQLQQQKEVDEAQLREKILQTQLAEQALRLSAEKLSAEKKERLLVELRQREEIDSAERRADSTRRAQEYELLRRDKDISDLRLHQQDNFRRFVYILGALGGLMLAFLLVSWLFARRASRRLAAQNQEIEAQKNLIEAERSKSDRLLLNVLPGEIAQELKTRGHADPRFYDAATVVFTDFVNFTRLSAQLKPEQILGELDECFQAFDEISDRFGLEKIKTIGDAFMCVGGLPLPNKTHPVDAVRAAMEMFAWLERRNQSNEQAVFREMRIGIHTGPVVAGVIGKFKFAYDIWGDAVNLAARMEELGEPGRINISGPTYEAVKHVFPCSYRGKKEVHNKGLVDMYFIEQAPSEGDV